MEIKLGSEEYVCNKKVAKSRKASEVHISIDGDYRGNYTISNQYREGISGVLELLKNEFKLYLLSGDNDSEKEQLATWFQPEHILFNQKP